MIDMMAKVKANSFFGNVNSWGNALRTLPDAGAILEIGRAHV